MCGIFGAHAVGASAVLPPERVLKLASDQMIARGPDAEGFWRSSTGRTVFAHRRLAIIDLDQRSNQPMRTPSGRYTIVFNGEIYNFRELRATLAKEHGTEFATNGDTEVLLHLYARYGAEMVHRLRGMFAFAIHDAETGQLFLARDPYGIKPLYYALTDGVFYFASQVKALEALGVISREIDPAAHVGFSLLGSVPEPFTMRRAIACLPAGHVLSVDDDGVGTARPYATMADAIDQAGVFEGAPENVAPVLADAVRQSVEAHLTADVPVGVFLSAGTDSGALAGLMRDCGQRSITAVTMAFEEWAGTPQDETQIASLVARHYELDHRVVTIRQDDFDTMAEKLFDAMDQPSIDGVNTWLVSKAASELGLKVVLSGLGGDELVAGYGNFARVPQYARIGAMMNRVGFAKALARHGVDRFGQRALRGNPKLRGVLDLDGSLASSYLLLRAVLLPWEIERDSDPAFFREGWARLAIEEKMRQALDPMPAHPLQAVSILESSFYMRNQLLKDSDWASMAHSLELRVPLVDWTLLQQVAPLQPFFGGNRGKAALAAAPRKALPAAVTDRPRSGFAVPLGKWSGMKEAATSRLSTRHWMSRVENAFGFPQAA